MLKAQSSIMDSFMTYPTGIRVKYSKYGLIWLELYVIKSFDLTQLANYLQNSMVEKSFIYKDCSCQHKSWKSTQGDRGGKRITHAETGCAKLGLWLASFQVENRQTCGNSKNQNVHIHSHTVTTEQAGGAGGQCGVPNTDRSWESHSAWASPSGNCNPLQYSCLEHSIDKGAWWAKESMGSQSVTHTEWLTHSPLLDGPGFRLGC